MACGRQAETVPGYGSEADFVALVDALLGNIFAHTPAGTPYCLSLEGIGDGMVELIVADEGAGFSDSGLLERGASGASSTGLGADIVRRTAEAAGGTAEWDSDEPSGTVARIVLPAAGTRPATTDLPVADSEN